MKGKASLSLIEQAVMLLVLAIAAALCLRAFVWADTQSRNSNHRDRAYVALQSAGEVLKFHRGDSTAAAQKQGGQVEDGVWRIGYDENWNTTGNSETFLLQAKPVETDTPYLGSAVLSVYEADGTTLAELTVCWQEDLP